MNMKYVSEIWLATTTASGNKEFQGKVSRHALGGGNEIYGLMPPLVSLHNWLEGRNKYLAVVMIL